MFPQAPYVTEDNPELLILLPLLPKNWDHRHALCTTRQVYVVLGVELRASCNLGNHSINCVPRAPCLLLGQPCTRQVALH